MSGSLEKFCDNNGTLLLSNKALQGAFDRIGRLQQRPEQNSDESDSDYDDCGFEDSAYIDCPGE